MKILWPSAEVEIIRYLAYHREGHDRPTFTDLVPEQFEVVARSSLLGGGVYRRDNLRAGMLAYGRGMESYVAMLALERGKEVRRPLLPLAAAPDAHATPSCL